MPRDWRRILRYRAVAIHLSARGLTLLRREWLNANNLTKTVGLVVAIFMLVAVAIGTFTGWDAVIIATFSLLTLVPLSVQSLLVLRRHRRRQGGGIEDQP